MSKELDVSTPEAFAAWVRRRRWLLKMSQADLARATGIQQSNLSAIESGTRAAGEDTRAKIARALSIRPSQALTSSRQDVIDAFARHGQPAPLVFGSVARHQDTLDSDIDLMTKIKRPFGLRERYRLTTDLEAILTVPVDVIDSDAPVVSDRIRKRLRKARDEAVPL